LFSIIFKTQKLVVLNTVYRLLCVNRWRGFGDWICQDTCYGFRKSYKVLSLLSERRVCTLQCALSCELRSLYNRQR